MSHFFTVLFLLIIIIQLSYIPDTLDFETLSIC